MLFPTFCIERNQFMEKANQYLVVSFFHSDGTVFELCTGSLRLDYSGKNLNKGGGWFRIYIEFPEVFKKAPVEFSGVM